MQKAQDGVSTVESIASNLSDATKVATAVGVIIGVSLVICNWVRTKTKVPFSNDLNDANKNDLKRYNDLCDLYKSKLNKLNTPSQWALDNNCPEFEADLSSSTEQFKQKCAKIKNLETPLKHSIAQIISSSERLFESIKKRRYSFYDYKKYRQDGFEKMFYCELIDWLTTELIASDIKSQATADMIQQRIAYCNAVKKSVFIYRDDDKIHNPIQNLDRIIDNLKLLHSDVCKSVQAASFNDSIDQMNACLLDMAVNAFGMCHLILKGVNQNDIQVDEFLNPDLKVDHKVISLLQTTLGQWIKATFNAVGIVGNNFQSTLPITQKMLDEHLKMDLEQLSLKNTGLPDFILKNENKNKKENKQFTRDMLRKIVNLHREILNIYYVKKSLVNSAHVNVELGQSRLYGTDKGKTLVRGLLFVVKDAKLGFSKTIKAFWSLFYDETYLPYAKLKGICNTNETYRYLDEADIRFKRILSCEKRLDTIIDTVKTKVRDYKNESEATLQREYNLISETYSHMCRRECDDEELLGLIKELAQEHISVPLTVLKAVQPKIEPYVVQFPLSRMPLYLQAKNLLSEHKDCPDNLLIMPRPKPFFSTLHEQLYDNFLNYYHSWVIANGFYSFLYSMTGTRINEIRTSYSRINTLMRAIYSDETTRRIKSQESIAPNLAKPFYQLAKGVVTCWDTELLLVNQCIREELFYLSKQINTGTLTALTSVSDFEILHVKIIKENIEVSIDRRLLNYAGAAFAKELADIQNALTLSQQEVADEKAAHAITQENLKRKSAEADGLLVKLTEKNTGLITVNNELAEKDNELVKKDNGLVKKDNGLVKKDNGLAAQNQTAEKLTHISFDKKTVDLTSSESINPQNNTVVFFKPPAKNDLPPKGKVKVLCACI